MQNLAACSGYRCHYSPDSSQCVRRTHEPGPAAGCWSRTHHLSTETRRTRCGVSPEGCNVIPTLHMSDGPARYSSWWRHRELQADEPTQPLSTPTTTHLHLKHATFKNLLYSASLPRDVATEPMTPFCADAWRGRTIRIYRLMCPRLPNLPYLNCVPNPAEQLQQCLVTQNPEQVVCLPPNQSTVVVTRNSLAVKRLKYTTWHKAKETESSPTHLYFIKKTFVSKF